MAVIASDVMNEARKVYLNDASATLYTNTVLLPFVQSAYADLASDLMLNGLQPLREISAVIDVAAGATSLNLPADFLTPIILRERLADSAEDWTDMVELSFEPAITQQGTTLDYWVYREDGIKFVGATTAREVLLYYYKSLATLSSDNSVIAILGAEDYLAARAAELAAKYIGMNPSLGEMIGKEAADASSKIVRRLTKANQALPTRRLPYKYRSKMMQELF